MNRGEVINFAFKILQLVRIFENLLEILFSLINAKRALTKLNPAAHVKICKIRIFYSGWSEIFYVSLLKINKKKN